MCEIELVEQMRPEDNRRLSFRKSIEYAGFTTPEGLYDAANDLRHISKADAVEVLYLLAIDAGVTDAGVTDALLNYGIFLWDEGRLREALLPLEKAYDARDQHAALTLAQVHLDLGDAETAIAWFERAEAHPAVPLRLARAYRALGDHQRALSVLQEAKDTNPEAAVELVLMGELKGDEAIALLQQHADWGSVDVLIPLANLHGEDNRPAEEIALLRRALDSGEPNAAHNLGLALWNAGHRQEGRTLLKDAARNGDKLAGDALNRLRRKRPRK
ncbi:tetratricopeptide repeat protein [Arthrobacter zhaoguopingii]|uniref:tetratricopeptide repeat protein n=1 Tax=Arthrobacter zhaoguopingii TaxID=2681491 RepID=UPI00135C3FC3|nr:CDC27 family protein [Arthrobacter zhaoguopingii]